MKDQIINHWFKEHKREIEWQTQAPIGPGDMEFLRWRKPGTCIYGVDYLRLSNLLYVSGDLGEAIYGGWDKGYPLEWIAGLNLDYFAQKCQASETGREYYEWDEKTARKRLLGWMENWEDPKDQEAKVRELGGFDVLHNEHEWVQWMHESGYQALGDEYYELGYAGRKINIRCQAHLIGLKLAFHQPLTYIGD